MKIWRYLFIWLSAIKGIHCIQKEYTIHLVPHSHQDVGWRETAENYYNLMSKKIETSTLRQLQKDGTRTFVEVEMYFIHEYFQKDATQQDKQLYRKLIQNGQLEILSGGWVSNDEATTHYDDIINQYMLGHKFAYENLGVIPKIVWHLDQFGHSAGMASILAQMGFDVLFFTREDFRDKVKRAREKELQFVWNPYPNYIWDVNIFTHSYFRHYSSLPELNVDLDSYNPTYLHEDKKFYVNLLAKFLETSKQTHKGNVKDFILLEGDDFSFQRSMNTFDELDQILDYVNQYAKNFQIKYSTPSKYYKALLEGSKMQNITYSIFKNDFFPYADQRAGYWTGFYTTKPILKGQIRRSSKIYHGIEKLAAINSLNPGYKSMENMWSDNLWIAKDALAKCQHHDAATGTSEEKVGKNYLQLLKNGDLAVSRIGTNLINNLFYNKYSQNIEFKFCHIQYKDNKFGEGITCPSITQGLAKGKIIILSIFNPSKSRSTVIKLPVRDASNGYIQVSDEYSNTVEAEILCQMKRTNTEETDCFLYIQSELNTLETKIYTIKPSRTNIMIGGIKIEHSVGIRNKYLSLEFSEKNGWKYCELDPLLDIDCEPVNLEINYNYYPSYLNIGQRSGHYIFRSDTRRPSRFATKLMKLQLFTGKLLQQITLKYDKILAHVRIFRNQKKEFELETFLPPFSLGDHENGKEIVLSITPSFSNSEGIFYTDSNGMSMQKNTYKRDEDSSIDAPQNYRPINSALIMKSSDLKYQISILNDRAQGGSYIEGNLEIMLDRLISSNDNRGLTEAIAGYGSKMESVNLIHTVIIENLQKNNSSSPQREIERILFEEPLIFYSYEGRAIPSTTTLNNIIQIYPWMNNVKYNLFFKGKNTIFIRFFNFRDEFDFLTEDQMNPRVNVEEFGIYIWNLVNTKKPRNVSITEVTLNHLQAKADEKREYWPTKSSIKEEFTKYKKEIPGQSRIIHPQRFRSFKLEFDK